LAEVSSNEKMIMMISARCHLSIDRRLAQIEERLEHLAGRPVPRTEDGEILDKLAAVQERLMSELQAVSKRLEAASVGRLAGTQKE
jgi:hypothetical protein